MRSYKFGSRTSVACSTRFRPRATRHRCGGVRRIPAAEPTEDLLPPSSAVTLSGSRRAGSVMPIWIAPGDDSLGVQLLKVDALDGDDQIKVLQHFPTTVLHVCGMSGEVPEEWNIQPTVEEFLSSRTAAWYYSRSCPTASVTTANTQEYYRSSKAASDNDTPECSTVDMVFS